MYKYLSLSADMQEMMVMMNSLPTCTIVFDRFGKLVEINQPAMTFLGIKNIDDYRLKRWLVLNDPQFTKETIRTLDRGVNIKDNLYIAKSPDGYSVMLAFNACLLNGTKKVFLFQFFELLDSFSSPSSQQDHMSLLSNYYFSFIFNCETSPQTQNQILTKEKRKLILSKVDENLIQTLSQSISEKYQGLTNREVFICVLIALGINTNQIAVITHSTVRNVQAIIYRLIKVFNARSRFRFNAELASICSIYI